MIVNPSFYKTETTNGDTNHYNTGTPSAHKKKRIRSDVVEKKMKKLKTSNWSLYDIRFKKPDVEFTQENFEHQCWEHLKDFSRDLLQILLIIRYLTGSFDKLENVNELKDGIEELSVLFELFVKPYAKMNEMFKTEYDIYEFIVDFLGFNYAKMKYGVTLIKVPEFFTNINNQKDICFFNKMVNDTIHTLLLKMYIEKRDEDYLVFKHYQTKEFFLQKDTLKDKILKEMYSNMIEQCRQPVEDTGFKHFFPCLSPIEAVLDDTHSIIYLGYCHRETFNGDFILDEATNIKKRYAVITAYYCAEPVMVDIDRVAFQYRSIQKLGCSLYAVFWENSEITFELDMEEQYRKYKESKTTVDINLPEFEPHANEEHCPEVNDEEATALFKQIREDMKKPWWRVFCKLPKISQPFECEKIIIQEYVEKFRGKVDVHYIIYGLSLLLGRLPEALEQYLLSIGVYKTFSTIFYSDPHDNELTDEECKRLEEKLLEEQKEIQKRLQLLWKQNNQQPVEDMSLKKLKSMLNEKAEWRRDKKKKAWDYITIIINRVINDDDEAEDRENEHGRILPGSMCKVESKNGEKYYYKYDDISRGLTRYPVSAINEQDQELFDSFHYLLENKNEKTIDSTVKRLANTKTACDCQFHSAFKKGKHGKHSVKRILCSGKGCSCLSGKKRAYDEHGRLNAEILEDKDFAIYECNSSCSCSINNCTNRVIQQGSHINMQLFKTAEKGWGVRTLQKIRKGQFIDEYLGELVGETEAEHRGFKYDQIHECSYLFDLTYRDDNKFTIDAVRYCSTSRWFNHSCEPNAIPRQVYVESHHPLLPRIALFALRDIQIGEEITFDYGYENKGRKECKCRAATCRKWLM